MFNNLVNQSSGLINQASGLGTVLDKGQQTFFQQLDLISGEELENIYIQSWAIRKTIDIPIDDMFVRPREWEGNDKKKITAINDYDEKYNFDQLISSAMKLARVMGSGMFVVMSSNAGPEVPLDIEKIKEGDISNFLVFDRDDAHIELWDKDLNSKDFGKPVLYRFLSYILPDPIYVHSSRVIKFDGIRPLSNRGWRNNINRGWGISEIIPIIKDVIYDATLSASSAHLVEEMSIPIYQIDGYKDALMGGEIPGEPTIKQIAENATANRSLFRMMLLDKSDSFQRVNYSFAGVPQLMDRSAQRIAAASGIPAHKV